MTRGNPVNIGKPKSQLISIQKAAAFSRWTRRFAARPSGWEFIIWGRNRHRVKEQLEGYNRGDTTDTGIVYEELSNKKVFLAVFWVCVQISSFRKIHSVRFLFMIFSIRAYEDVAQGCHMSEFFITMNVYRVNYHHCSNKLLISIERARSQLFCGAIGSKKY